MKTPRAFPTTARKLLATENLGTEAIKHEAAHYAAVYRQDGEVKVRMWKNRQRKVVSSNGKP